MNENGVFELLGLGGFFFGYVARYKWPEKEKRTTLAFEPMTNNVRFLGQEMVWPFKTGPGPEGDRAFEASRGSSGGF